MTLRMDNANIIRITTDSPQLIRVDNAKIISTSELLDMVEPVSYTHLFDWGKLLLGIFRIVMVGVIGWLMHHLLNKRKDTPLSLIHI